VLLERHSVELSFRSAIPKGPQSSPNPSPSMRVLVGFMGREPLGMAADTGALYASARWVLWYVYHYAYLVMLGLA